MNWTPVLVVVGLVFVFLLWRHLTQISPDQARRHLAEGALVIDVRTPEEFREGHVRDSINIPLGQVVNDIAKQVPDRERVLLLHCLSGGRSGIATQQLRRLGYTRVFNLGSLSRAQSIVEAR